MKQRIRWLLLGIICTHTINAQSKTGKTYRNFPIVFSVQFHSLSYPLKDLRSNFKNVGFGVGTEIALGSSHDWAQQFQVSWYNNKQAGNGILLYTQSAWRPTIVSHIYTELKAGFGYTYSFRPMESWQEKEGIWSAVGHKEKWLFTVPVGVSLGYNKFSEHTYVVPFVTYQVLLNAHYNNDIPVITNSLFQVGARIHLPKNI
ncbi:MAG: hypothetical protein ABI863_23235 [Ginsengibacter sp.]